MPANTDSIFRVDSLIIMSSTCCSPKFYPPSFCNFENTPCSISSLILINTAIQINLQRNKPVSTCHLTEKWCPLITLEIIDTIVTTRKYLLPQVLLATLQLFWQWTRGRIRQGLDTMISQLMLNYLPIISYKFQLVIICLFSTDQSQHCPSRQLVIKYVSYGKA